MNNLPQLASLLKSRDAIDYKIATIIGHPTAELLNALRERGVQFGTGTSITGPLWERAEIYPVQRNHQLILSNDERTLLALFR